MLMIVYAKVVYQNRYMNINGNKYQLKCYEF